ncbi:MAG: hypothetical protein RLZZ237_4363 [Pseudomonadota bacterium]|jgi:hypothetical protein
MAGETRKVAQVIVLGMGKGIQTATIRRHADAIGAVCMRSLRCPYVLYGSYQIVMILIYNIYQRGVTGELLRLAQQRRDDE